MNITLSGTKITQDTRNLAFEKNSGVDEIVITVDTDESWSYKLDVKYPDKYNVENDALYNIIDLDRNGNTCSVTLNSEMLQFNGKYIMQLRGINGDKVYHSDIFEVWVKYSIEPGSTYNPVPSEFYQVEARLDDKVNEAKQYAENAEIASTRMPKISSDNTWLIWDVETGDYVDTGVKASGSNVDAKAREDISKLSKDISKLSEEIANLQTSGLTTAQVNALDGMFKVAVYDDSKDVSGAYAAFKSAFGLVDSGGGGEETPGVTTYTITAELVNVTSSNSATSVTEGASYTATLTAADGYKLDAVSVLMGGVDVTADVYANGVISIASVTGNVEIVASAAAIEDMEAVLPEDGLLAYFDFRNVAESSGDNSKGYYIPATKGTGRMYGWYKSGGGNDYGSKTNPNFCAGDSYTIHDFGSEFTWILKSHCAISYTVLGFKNYITPSNTEGGVLGPTYNTAEGTAAVSREPLGNVLGYNDVVIRVSNRLLSVFVNSELVKEYNGNNISDFVSWYSKATIGVSWNADNSVPVLITAAAFYSRALSDAEVVEACEYMKTLEVSA